MPKGAVAVHEADRQARRRELEIVRELRVARLTGGLRQRDVARAMGISTASVCRIERGDVARVSLRVLARFAGAVGLVLWVRAYPGGRRFLDAPQLSLFGRFRRAAHPSWGWETEVPMPIAGDLRAADVRGRIPGCVVMVELVTRIVDFQAQSRSALLKKRDLRADRLVLVAAATKANRHAVAELEDVLAASFPLGTRAVMAALREGRDPGADGLVLL